MEFVFYSGERYAVEDCSATMLADPDTLSTLRTTLLQPRPVPPRRASDARGDQCQQRSHATLYRTGYLSYAVGHEHVRHQLHSCKG